MVFTLVYKSKYLKTEIGISSFIDLVFQHILHLRTLKGIKKSMASKMPQEARNLPKKQRMSTKEFHFKKHCLFCGKECLPFDPKHPDRRPKVLQCRTLPKAGPTFKETILEICKQRGDKQAEDVCMRLLGAPTDLHAADAQYHKNCYSSLASYRNVKVAKTHSTDERHSVTRDVALNHVLKVMEDIPERIWTSTELYHLYGEQGKSSLR